MHRIPWSANIDYIHGTGQTIHISYRGILQKYKTIKEWYENVNHIGYYRSTIMAVIFQLEINSDS